METKEYKQVTAKSKADVEDELKNIASITFTPSHPSTNLKIKHRKGDVVERKRLFGLLSPKYEVCKDDVIVYASNGDSISSSRRKGAFINDDGILMEAAEVKIVSKKYFTDYRYFNNDKDAFEYFEDLKKSCASVGNPMD